MEKALFVAGFLLLFGVGVAIRLRRRGTSYGYRRTSRHSGGTYFPDSGTGSGGTYTPDSGGWSGGDSGGWSGGDCGSSGGN